MCFGSYILVFHSLQSCVSSFTFWLCLNACYFLSLGILKWCFKRLFLHSGRGSGIVHITQHGICTFRYRWCWRDSYSNTKSQKNLVKFTLHSTYCTGDIWNLLVAYLHYSHMIYIYNWIWCLCKKSDPIPQQIKR